MNTPSIGRIVHVVLENGTHRPAIITDVHIDGGTSLTVFLAAGDMETQGIGAFGIAVKQPLLLWALPECPHSEEPKPLTWHWPEFVKPEPEPPKPEESPFFDEE